MSLFSTLSRAAPAALTPTSGIRSATGLPRAALADYYRRNGLFGRDSALDSAQQIIVQSRLGPLPGVPQVPAPEWSAAFPRRLELRLLAEHVDALIAGRTTRDDAARLQAWGFKPAALSEVERTVHNVQDIFGPRALPAKADVHETVIAEAAFARAA